MTEPVRNRSSRPPVREAGREGGGDRSGGPRRRNFRGRGQGPHPSNRPDGETTARANPITEILPPAYDANGKPKLRVYALGGLEEVGRNCTIFECGDDIVIVDMGIQFPEEDMHGVDFVIPNIASLLPKKKNIRGILVTHGHFDHLGAIPYVLDRLGNPPIFTAPLTAGYIRKRQEEFPNSPKVNIVIVKPKMKIALGKHFVFEPFHLTHSIIDAFGIALQTPYGTILHTGDFKFDYTPVNDEPADLIHIASYGARNPLMLSSDSTDSMYPGLQISEHDVIDELRKIFVEAEGRIIFGTFASLLTRIQIIISLAEEYGRKVLIQGRSMHTSLEIAHELGYMKYKKDTIIEESDFTRLPDNKVIVICTGAQGQKNAQLMRMANKEHRLISIKPGDALVFSSSVIPGNERTIQSLKDVLVRHGAKMYHTATMDIHAGGHGKAEDLKLMLRLTRPRYFMPIHGNRYMLQIHADLARGVGIPKENIFVADNGQIMEFDDQGGRLTEERVNTDYVMVDGLGVGDVSEIVLRDRQMLAEDGMFVVIMTIEKKTGQLVGSPDIISRGFIYLKESKELIERARMRVKKIMKEGDRQTPAFEDYIKNKIRNDIGQFLYHETHRRPMVLPVLIEV